MSFITSPSKIIKNPHISYLPFHFASLFCLTNENWFRRYSYKFGSIIKGFKFVAYIFNSSAPVLR